MKTQKQIESMLYFFNFLNNGIMDEKYREGVIHALNFVLYQGSSLENMKNAIKKYLKNENDN